MISLHTNLQYLKESIIHTTENRPYSIHYTEVDTNQTNALYLHWHAEYELFYVSQGEVTLYLNEHAYLLKCGSAILIPPFVLHHAEKQEAQSCTHYAFVFCDTYLTSSVPDASYQCYLDKLQNIDLSSIRPITGVNLWEKQFLDALRNLYDCYQKPIKSCELLIHGYFLLICHLLTSHLISCPLDGTLTKRRQKLKSAMDYMHSHYSEEITLEQLAKTVYLSKEQFCRSFKQLTQVSAFYYLNRYRIQKSCELLICTNKKVAEIAPLCGFNNISYFNREFKKFIHMSPNAYRSHVH